MGQLGFFDLSRRYEGLDVKDDPLVAIAAMIPWESLRPKLKASLITGGLRASDVARKSPAGRKPWDEVVIFKALVLQALYNLSDDQAEYQLRDRLSFMRFLGLGLEDAVPDAKRAGSVCWNRVFGLISGMPAGFRPPRSATAG